MEILKLNVVRLNIFIIAVVAATYNSCAQGKLRTSRVAFLIIKLCIST